MMDKTVSKKSDRKKTPKEEARIQAEKCIGTGNRRNRRAAKYRPNFVIAVSTGAVDTNIHADAPRGYVKKGGY